MNEIKMTKIRGVCAVTIALACSACGGGGGGTVSIVATATPNPIPVIFDNQGDSTMASWKVVNGVMIMSNPTVEQMLQSDLQTGLGSKYTVSVLNHGLARTQLCQRMNGTGLFTTRLADDLKTSPAQKVIEAFGINEPNQAIGIESPTQFQQCLEEFVDTVRAAGKTPILEEPNPITVAATSAEYVALLDTYVAVIGAVAQEKGVTLIPQYHIMQTIPNWEALLSDGVHPLEAGYEVKAQNEANVLVPIIKASK